MPLDRRFVKAEILEMPNSQAWTLKIHYSYFSLYNFIDVFVYGSREACERKLLEQRCGGFLTIRDKAGESISFVPVE
jgi:hypothetical protein